jgi:hypothetical protein
MNLKEKRDLKKCEKEEETSFQLEIKKKVGYVQSLIDRSKIVVAQESNSEAL